MSHEARAIIAEDERLLAQGLREALAELWPELLICAAVDDGIQALRALDEHAPDILFLDIQMPGLSGIEVARQVNGRCHVVFVTAFDEYAVQAFEQGAVDYVLKPLSTARLATSVGRLKKCIGSAPARLDGLLERLADAARQRPPALDHGGAGSRSPPDHGRARCATSARTTSTPRWSRRTARR